MALRVKDVTKLSEHTLEMPTIIILVKFSTQLSMNTQIGSEPISIRL